MKTYAWIACALALSACAPLVPIEDETIPDETGTTITSSGETTTTPSDTSTATSTTSTTSTTSSSTALTCSSGLLGWEPQKASDFEPFSGTFAYAASLPPFAVDTVCQTVLVGLYTGEGDCGSPSSIDVFSSAEAGPAPPPGVTPLPTTYALGEAEAVLMLTPKAGLYHFHRTMVFPAGQHPFVGMITTNACAIGGFPACDAARAWRHDGLAFWHKLVDDTGAEDQLFFGLANCAAVSP